MPVTPNAYRRIRALSLVAAFALFMQWGAQASVLESHTAYYDVRIKVFKGAMVTKLEGAEKVFTGTSEVSPRGFARFASKGKIQNQSMFQLTQNGVQPLSFQGNDSISKRKKKAELNFDWDTFRITGLASEKRKGKRIETIVDAPMDVGMQDGISLQYALMHDLQNDSLKTQYTLADGDKQKRINVTRLDSMQLRVPYGEFDVVPLQHQVEGSSRVTTFWCAKELNYLPVKIEQHRKGKRLMRAELGRYELSVP